MSTVKKYILIYSRRTHNITQACCMLEIYRYPFTQLWVIEKAFNYYENDPIQIFYVGVGMLLTIYRDKNS